MKKYASLLLIGPFVVFLASYGSEKSQNNQSAGHACDSARFLEIANAVEETRKRNRLSEAEFAKALKEPGTIVLDARGREFYEKLHVVGAVNLPYTHFADTSLRAVIPDRSTRILIYCRNNFKNPPEDSAHVPAKPEAFALRVIEGREVEVPVEYEPPEVPKIAKAGLNIPTFITLHSYGYENVWELDDVVDPDNSLIPFAREKPRRLDAPVDPPAEK
jgi:hypothetical protein